MSGNDSVTFSWGTWMLVLLSGFLFIAFKPIRCQLDIAPRLREDRGFILRADRYLPSLRFHQLCDPTP